MATIRKEFDDEALSRLLMAEYKKMKGFRVSAKRFKSITLLPYRSATDLHDGLAYRNRAFGSDEDFLREEQLLRLVRNPRLGRKRNSWTQWVSKLPGNRKATNENDESVAVEIVQEWSVAGIALVTMAVLILSLAATLLWIFLGEESSSIVSFGPIDQTVSPDSQDSSVYRIGSDRVETGVAIGVLVLLFGWSGVGAWVLISWLAA